MSTKNTPHLHPRLILSCTAHTPDDYVDIFKKLDQNVLEHIYFLEIRVDHLYDPLSWKEIVDYAPKRLILTYRSLKEGGNPRNSQISREILLNEFFALAEKFNKKYLIDVELRQDIIPKGYQFPVLWSFHGHLDELSLTKVRPGDFVKIVSTKSDFETLLQLKELHADCLIATGMHGWITRLDQKFIKNKLMYSTLKDIFTPADASQLDIRFMINHWEYEDSFGLGLIGYPIEKTLSPAFHNYWLEKLSLGGFYYPLAVKTHEGIQRFIDWIPRSDFIGFNVTTPWKEHIQRYLDSLDPISRSSGSINTVVKVNNKLVGYNTDIYGIQKTLENILPLLSEETPILLLGAGGAAKSSLIALEGCKAPIVVWNRSKEHMDKFKEQFPKIILWEEDSLIKPVLAINATSAGNDFSPYIKKLLRSIPYLFDMEYYRSYEQSFLSLNPNAQAKIAGWRMLVYQALAAFKLWTGKEPPSKEAEKIMIKIAKERGFVV